MNKYLKTYKEYRWRTIVGHGKPYEMMSFERTYMPIMYIEAMKTKDPKYVTNSMSIIIYNLINDYPKSINNFGKYLKYLNSFSIQDLLTERPETIKQLKPYIQELTEYNVIGIFNKNENLKLLNFLLSNLNNFDFRKFITYCSMELSPKKLNKVLDLLINNGHLNKITDPWEIKKILNNPSLEKIHQPLLNTLNNSDRDFLDVMF